ncbi:MAG: gliding motility protein GldN [Bacteroidaceae bacterium]|nr:gliding motility protein GldN [Bacteroidaceae bacterium]
MKTILLPSITCILLCLPLMLSAQPKKSRVTRLATKTVSPVASKAKETPKKVTSDRAALQFPTSDEMPEDVVWRRDIYRQLDLMKDANAPLYYPVEPNGKNQNLFTYLFRLILSERLTAYQYKLDGNESFDAKDKLDLKDLLDRYYILYEEKNGKYSVSATDIPSAEVTRYYIKESNYFDQRSATFKRKVTAICPVLMRGEDEFGGEATPYPLFWVNYDDVAGYLNKMPMMASNLNNVTNMTADDYFTMNKYEGKIYKTNNLQGKVLANYCKTDSAMKAEQKRIEDELAEFERSIWEITSAKSDSVAVDSTAVADKKEKKVKAKAKSETRRSKAAVSEKPQTTSTPRVSVRRQRR